MNTPQIVYRVSLIMRRAPYNPVEVSYHTTKEGAIERGVQHFSSRGIRPITHPSHWGDYLTPQQNYTSQGVDLTTQFGWALDFTPLVVED